MKNTALACFLLLLLVALAIPSGCYYDNEEDLYGGPGGCDTTDIRYSVEVRNILENQCYSCHTVSSNVSGFPFDNYVKLKQYADNGLLVELMNTPGPRQMPPAGLLPDCDRRKIEAWVKAGAPEN